MLPNKEMCSSLSTSMCHKFFFYRTQFLLVFRKFLATHFPSWYQIRNDLYQYFVIGAHWYQNISNKAYIDQEQCAVLVYFERGLVQYNVQFLLLNGYRAMLTCALQSFGVNSGNVALHVGQLDGFQQIQWAGQIMATERHANWLHKYLVFF